jgi:hypothetical protein
VFGRAKIVRRSAALAVVVAVLGAAQASAEFPQTPPDDPSYPVDARCSRASGEFFLLSEIPPQCIAASDPEAAPGMSVDAAWKRFTTGTPDTLVSYTEGGINWRLDNARDFVDRTFLNTRELPLPQRAGGSACASFDCNGDGRVSVSDYADDPRIARPYINDFLTPEDLVVAFGHCQIKAGTLGACPEGGRFDNDHNGFPNDISGWDFVHNSNDVQTDWSEYTHANAQALNLVGEADNGQQGVGVCPDCTVVFIKGGDEAITTPMRQAMATIYAATIGVDVVTRESVSLGQSSFQRRTFQAALRRGVATSDDASDFDSNSHTEGMLLDDSLPGNGLVQDATATALVTGFRDRSTITSWGSHAVLSVPTKGGTSSEATPIQGGLMALVAAEGHRVGAGLKPREITQLLISSASRIDDPSLPWPGKPDADWSKYYGYGRPNALRAMELIDSGQIPPIADIDSPGWYQRFDPVTDRHRVLAIRGTASALRADSAHYEVDYAFGPEPADSDFQRLATGQVDGKRKGVLARLPLKRIPKDFASAPYSNTGDRTTTSGDNYERYAVTLRLTVTDDSGQQGVDRQVFYAQHDPDRLPGFPIRLGSSGESQPVIADLNGDGRNEAVVATTDGLVHAYTAKGRELKGWPVHTRRSPEVLPYRHNPLLKRLGIPRDPIIASVAIGDLNHDGKLEVVASTTGARVYAWGSDGRLRKGFPHTLGQVGRYPVPSPAINGHSPVVGAGSHPVLADLDGNGKLEILQSTATKSVYALRPNGRDLPGWPVKLDYPGTAPSLFTVSIVVASPAVGDIDGDGQPDVIIGSQDSISTGAPSAAVRPLYAIRAAGTKAPGGPFLPGWPVLLPDTLNGVTGGIDFVVGANSSPLLADLDSNGSLDVVASTSFGTPLAFDGSGRQIQSFTGLGNSPSGAEPVLTFTGSAAPARVGSRLQIISPGSAITDLGGSLVGVTVPGTGIEQSRPIYNFERGWDAATGQQLDGFPRIQQGLAFFGEPSIADVDGDGSPEVLQTTDSFILHAFHLDGPGEAAGYPRFTGGWGTYSPGVGDLDGDGHPDVLVSTREGYLDAFRGAGEPGDAQWCAFQGSATHDGLERGRCEIPASRASGGP